MSTRVCAVSLFKSIQRQLVEWLDYHFLIGVDHFYLCQDVSSDIERRLSERLLEPYITDKRVTLYYAGELFPNTVNLHYSKRQRPFYDLILKQLQVLRELNPYEWMICLDVDDFFVPKIHGTLPLFLEQFNPDEITGVMLNGMMFGSGNSSDIPIFTPPSVIETCQSYLMNKNYMKSIGSIKHSTYWHSHHPMGDKALVNAENLPTNFVNPVESYSVAFCAHYIQPSLESLNLKWQNANYPYSDAVDSQRSLRDIAMNRFTNNEWINYPQNNRFDPTVKSTVVLDLYNLRKHGLLPEPVVEELQLEPVEEPQLEPIVE
ncbi:MAG: glycosyltransferase family 92 protein [Planctomycetaceae bacterium]|jgi:hypothetical protein|nr:glycosyltransferase family 92 protein [Planctomycetaceae bacterium]